MAFTVLESHIFKDMFGCAAMREVFDEKALLGRYVEVEQALAKVQGELGVIPQEAAQQIVRLANVEMLNLDELKADTENVGYPILPLVKQLSRMCGEAGQYLHWGATTQDIMDTATVLQVRAAVELLEQYLAELESVLDGLSERHQFTVMAGRTHLQHALPVTFGYKAAVWLWMLKRHRERLEQMKPRVLMGQLGGAAGTLASLGEQGLAVQAALMEELGLTASPITWHVARDGLAELIQLLGLISGSLGKIALDVMLMMSNELGEVFEPFVPGRGASSTMPQKRNPISSELIWNASKIVRQHTGLALDFMMPDFERATGPWHLEWTVIPETFVLTAGALKQACFMLSGLEVNTEKMKQNLDSTKGLIVAEAVMMALAPRVGRQVAHDWVYESCRQSLSTGQSLLAVLSNDDRIMAQFSMDQLTALCDPVNYVGAAPSMVDRVRTMNEQNY